MLGGIARQILLHRRFDARNSDHAVTGIAEIEVVFKVILAKALAVAEDMRGGRAVGVDPDGALYRAYAFKLEHFKLRNRCHAYIIRYGDRFIALIIVEQNLLTNRDNLNSLIEGQVGGNEP